MIKASNPGLFIILNHTLLSCVILSVGASLCGMFNSSGACSAISNVVAVITCFLFLYVWYRLFTWKCE